MAVLGSSSIAPALPKVVQELGVSPGQVGLLITVFTLPGVFLTSVAGALSDRFGRRKILVPSLMLFSISVRTPQPATTNFQAFSVNVVICGTRRELSTICCGKFCKYGG
jgi:MFS family permease